MVAEEEGCKMKSRLGAVISCGRQMVVMATGLLFFALLLCEVRAGLGI